MANDLYGNKSRYKDTPIRSWYLGIWEPVEITESEDDNLFIIPPKFHLRPDLAAFELYGDHRYWYVFALRNKNLIKDPIFDFISGMSIYVPKQERLTGI